MNWGDFEPIFTIFINIFIMMNSILGFTWRLVLKVLGKSVGGENAKVPSYEVKW